MQSTFSLAPTIEEAATGFFFSNYVIDARGPTKGHLEHLHNIYNTYQMDENLLASMTAVGLAGYAHVAHAPQLMKDARRQYVKALRLTNEALRSPTDAKKDSTLLAIMILGIFEIATGCNQKSLQAWAEHVSGAAALLSLRGMERLRTIADRRMFAQVCTNIVTSCIQRRLPIPTHIIELRAQIAKHIPQLDPGWCFLESMIAFANFRSETGRGIISDPQAILSKAMKIDGEVQAMFLYAPPEWQYEIVFTDDTDCRIHNGSYHVYYDYWVFQLWNGMRTTRILLNEQIREVILAGLSSKPPLFLGPEYTAQVQISTDVILQMQADILATVPQHTGYVGNTHASLSIPPSSDLFPSSDNSKPTVPWTSFTNSSYFTPNHDTETPQTRAVGGYFLMWPLFLCGVIDLASESTRCCVTQMLQYIGRTMGIQQAFMVAKIVERREEIKVWWDTATGR